MTSEEFNDLLNSALQDGLIILKGPREMADQVTYVAYDPLRIRMEEEPADVATVGPENPPRSDGTWERLTELTEGRWNVTAASPESRGPFVLTIFERLSNRQEFLGVTPDACVIKAVDAITDETTVTALIHAYRDTVNLIEALAAPSPMIGHLRYDDQRVSYNGKVIDELRKLRDVLAADLAAHGMNTDGTPHIV